MRTAMLRACGALTAGIVVATCAAADTVTLAVELASPREGSYRLTGQSAFIVVQTGGSTSGGQLDGVESPGATIVYNEVFPPPSLSDYLTFGYFGLVETLDAGGDVVDLSLVMALRSGVGTGQAIGDLFAGQDEATLVAAFQTPDSPEFLSMLDAVAMSAFAQGDVGIPPIGRPGETLTLVAFTDGLDGTLGVGVGTLSDTTVPAPAGACVFGAAALAYVRRRRR